VTEIRDQKSAVSKILPLRSSLVALSFLSSLLLAPCSATQAQQTGKVPRIGFLDRSTAAGSALLLKTFQQELSKLGWVEGKKITIDYRFAEQKRSACLSLRPSWCVLRWI
jgi:hypothetical protein